MRFIVGMLIIVDETDEKAQTKYEEYLSYVDIEGSLALIGGWTGMDLGPYKDDDDLKFDKPAGITSVVTAFTSNIPGRYSFSHNISLLERIASDVVQEVIISGGRKSVSQLSSGWVVHIPKCKFRCISSTAYQLPLAVLTK